MPGAATQTKKYTDTLAVFMQKLGSHLACFLTFLEVFTRTYSKRTAHVTARTRHKILKKVPYGQTTTTLGSRAPRQQAREMGFLSTVHD